MAFRLLDAHQSYQLGTAPPKGHIFAASAYQARIFEWIATGRGSCVVVAVAGSGKSTTIKHSLLYISPRASVQVLAFNKPIADDMNAGIKKLFAETGHSMPGLRCGTFHSLGNYAVRKALGIDKDVQPDGRKCQKLCEEWLDYNDRDENTGGPRYLPNGKPFVPEGIMYGDYACRLVAFAKGQGIGVLEPDTLEKWWDLARHHDLTLDHEDADETRAIEIARELLTRSNAAAKERHLLDFDDMLYLPLLYRLRLWQNDWVFVDEAQDTNPVRRALAKLALKPGGRLVAVGDPRQAIYGFTGASHDAIDLIKREFSAVELPLTVSYRCAQSVVRQAQTIVDYIEAAPSAPEGKVETLQIKDTIKLLGEHDAVLCRTNAPLVNLAYQLIASGKPCKILGREIGVGLVKLIRNLKADSISHLLERVETWQAREVAKYTGRGEENKAQSVSDRAECIRVVAENLNEDDYTIAALVARIEGLFSDTNGCLMLSTAHKSKGREWDRVAILRPDLMPSKWARQQWQQTQEQNLQYVAWTRAKSHLIFMEGETLK